MVTNNIPEVKISFKNKDYKKMERVAKMKGSAVAELLL